MFFFLCVFGFLSGVFLKMNDFIEGAEEIFIIGGIFLIFFKLDYCIDSWF